LKSPLIIVAQRMAAQAKMAAVNFMKTPRLKITQTFCKQSPKPISLLK